MLYPFSDYEEDEEYFLESLDSLKHDAASLHLTESASCSCLLPCGLLPEELAELEATGIVSSMPVEAALQQVTLKEEDAIAPVTPRTPPAFDVGRNGADAGPAAADRPARQLSARADEDECDVCEHASAAEPPGGSLPAAAATATGARQAGTFAAVLVTATVSASAAAATAGAASTAPPSEAATNCTAGTVEGYA